MRIASTLVLGLGLVVAAACQSNTPSSPTLQLSVAEATAACGPADGPAVELRLGNVAGQSLESPQVRATVFEPRSALAGRSFDLTEEQFFAGLRRADGEYVLAVEGRLTIERVAANGTIDGQLSLRFPDGTRVEQRFSAPWRERAMLCG